MGLYGDIKVILMVEDDQVCLLLIGYGVLCVQVFYCEYVKYVCMIEDFLEDWKVEIVVDFGEVIFGEEDWDV